MKLIQVYNQDGEQFLFKTERDLSDKEIEEIIIESSKFDDDDEAEQFLDENGIERTFIDVEVYL